MILLLFIYYTKYITLSCLLYKLERSESKALFQRVDMSINNIYITIQWKRIQKSNVIHFWLRFWVDRCLNTRTVLAMTRFDFIVFVNLAQAFFTAHQRIALLLFWIFFFFPPSRNIFTIFGCSNNKVDYMS